MAVNANIDENIICKFNILALMQEGIKLSFFQDNVNSKLIVNFDFNFPYHVTTNSEFQFKLVFIEIKPVQCELKTKKKKQERPSQN